MPQPAARLPNPFAAEPVARCAPQVAERMRGASPRCGLTCRQPGSCLPAACCFATLRTFAPPLVWCGTGDSQECQEWPRALHPLLCLTGRASSSGTGAAGRWLDVLPAASTCSSATSAFVLVYACADGGRAASDMENTMAGAEACLRCAARVQPGWTSSLSQRADRVPRQPPIHTCAPRQSGGRRCWRDGADRGGRRRGSSYGRFCGGEARRGARAAGAGVTRQGAAHGRGAGGQGGARGRATVLAAAAAGQVR